MVPFDTQSPFVTSGIRVGAQAVTTRGFDESDCIQVVNWIDTILKDPENDALAQQVKGEINTFMERFPLYEKSSVIA